MPHSATANATLSHCPGGIGRTLRNYRRHEEVTRNAAKRRNIITPHTHTPHHHHSILHFIPNFQIRPWPNTPVPTPDWVRRGAASLPKPRRDSAEHRGSPRNAAEHHGTPKLRYTALVSYLFRRVPSKFPNISRPNAPIPTPNCDRRSTTKLPKPRRGTTEHQNCTIPP